MSRGDGSYDGEFMEDYTDYDISCHNGDSMMSDIDYYSSMEGMGVDGFRVARTRVPHDGPKDSNAGGYTREILDRNETR
jgi:hypothetical protein